MKRVMLQTYVSNAAEAIALYTQAFDARLLAIYNTPDGKVVHSELDIDGIILAVADREDSDGIADNTGNTMQFCQHYEAGKESVIKRAYEALFDGGLVRFPLGPCDYSPCMTDIIDRFGVRWCLFTD